jgi:hypothetical protein
VAGRFFARFSGPEHPKTKMHFTEIRVDANGKGIHLCREANGMGKPATVPIELVPQRPDRIPRFDQDASGLRGKKMLRKSKMG